LAAASTSERRALVREIVDEVTAHAQAEDAVLLDTSELAEASVVDRMEALARARFGADLP